MRGEGACPRQPSEPIAHSTTHPPAATGPPTDDKKAETVSPERPPARDPRHGPAWSSPRRRAASPATRNARSLGPRLGTMARLDVGALSCVFPVCVGIALSRFAGILFRLVRPLCQSPSITTIHVMQM